MIEVFFLCLLFCSLNEQIKVRSFKTNKQADISTKNKSLRHTHSHSFLIKLWEMEFEIKNNSDPIKVHTLPIVQCYCKVIMTHYVLVMTINLSINDALDIIHHKAWLIQEAPFGLCRIERIDLQGRGKDSRQNESKAAIFRCLVQSCFSFSQMWLAGLLIHELPE